MRTRMDLNALVLFYEAVNSQSISQAATRLGVPKSTVSRKISVLEHQVGSTLVRRGAQGISLTEVGTVLYDHAQKIITEIEDAGFHASEMQSELVGVLRISLPVDFGVSWLSRLIAEFARNHTEIRLVVDINNRWVDVTEEPYDVAVHLGRPRKADAAYVALLEQVVDRDPQELGYSFTIWTLDRLRLHMEAETGILLSQTQFRLLLKEHDFVYRRPKHDLTNLQDSQARQTAEAWLDELKKGPQQEPSTFSLWTKAV